MAWEYLGEEGKEKPAVARNQTQGLSLSCQCSDHWAMSAVFSRFPIINFSKLHMSVYYHYQNCYWWLQYLVVMKLSTIWCYTFWLCPVPEWDLSCILNLVVHGYAYFLPTYKAWIFVLDLCILVIMQVYTYYHDFNRYMSHTNSHTLSHTLSLMHRFNRAECTLCSS